MSWFVISGIILNLSCVWSKKFCVFLTTVWLMNKICHCPEQPQIWKSHLQFSISLNREETVIPSSPVAWQQWQQSVALQPARRSGTGTPVHSLDWTDVCDLKTKQTALSNGITLAHSLWPDWLCMTWQENQTKHGYDSDLLILIGTFMYKDPQNKRPKLEHRRITKWTAKKCTDNVITSLWGITKISSPNCWMARSALQGSSSVMCTRRFWFSARRSACSEIPELAASEMMATSCGN